MSLDNCCLRTSQLVTKNLPDRVVMKLVSCFVDAHVQMRTLFNPNLYGGGKFAPQAVFCYSSKTVGARLLKLCGFYC